MTRRLPAEWEPQAGVLLAWPHAGTDWRPLLEAVEPVYAALVGAIASRESALVVCSGPDHAGHVRGWLKRASVEPSRVRLHEAPTDDTWTRDYGPVTVMSEGRPLLLDFRFDGWGGKYPAGRDDALTGRLHRAGVFGDTPIETVGRVLEGGSIEGDGAGTVLTTRRCLMSRAGPGTSTAAVEADLRASLGATRVLWLEHGGLEGDDTDGHVDTLARFCDPHTIAYVRCDDPGDPHFSELAAMEAELRAFRTPSGSPYRLVPLPWPSAKHDAHGQRLPATYANFLVVNGAVLVPAYDDPADTTALARVAAAFPGREAVPVPSLPLIHQHGSLHCATMQIPAEVPLP
jgi:agmatine/peptidylarginine deiminase